MAQVGVGTGSSVLTGTGVDAMAQPQVVLPSWPTVLLAPATRLSLQVQMDEAEYVILSRVIAGASVILQPVTALLASLAKLRTGANVVAGTATGMIAANIVRMPKGRLRRTGSISAISCEKYGRCRGGCKITSDFLARISVGFL